jgi:predicted DNA binding CopG/RHH family protein
VTTPEKIHPENSPDKSARADNGGASATGGNAEVHDRTGLYISILALAMAGVALGLWLNQSAVIDAKVEAAVAKAKSEIQEQVSDAKATANANANEARINSRVALDKVEDVRAKLAEKGIHINLDGH